MKKSHLLAAVYAFAFSFNSIPSHAVLIDNGGGLIYDDVLEITWAQPDIERAWDDANNWVSELTLGGVSGWRLPYISVEVGTGQLPGDPINCDTATEVACRDNELGYMFYQNLGGISGIPITESGDPDLGLFPALQPVTYWSGTMFDPGTAWGFNFSIGDRTYGTMNGNVFAWAVHDGNVSATVVPEPPMMWLLATGLLGIGIARKKAA